MNASALPRLSVVVPNYNHGHFLPACLNALLHQSVPAFEIIVIDDASTDRSREILDQFAREHPVLRLCPNDRNRGVNYGMQRGLELVQGDYVLFAAADDQVVPGLFEKSLRLLAQYPQAGLCCAIAEWREQWKGGLTWQMGVGMADKPGYLPPAEMVRLGKQRKLYIISSSSLIRIDALRQAGGFPENLLWHADWFGTYVTGFRHGICFVPEVLSVAYLQKQSFFQNRDQIKHGQVLRNLVERLCSEACTDVMPLIRDAGELALFATPMLRILKSKPEYRHFINATLLRKLFRRNLELRAKRLLPAWLARLCLKVFYRPLTAPAAEG